jgi:hypothetical protein
MLEMLIPLLSRWKWGLALAGLLAFTGLGAAAFIIAGPCAPNGSGVPPTVPAMSPPRPRPRACLPKRSTIRKRSTG